MSHTPVAAASDRLPWLADEVTPDRRRGNGRDLAGWALAAALLVVAGAVWIKPHELATSPASAPLASTTIALPEPLRALPPQPQVALEPPPEVRPAPQRDVRIARPPVEKNDIRRVVENEAPASNRTAGATSEPAAAAAASPATARPLSLWPAWQSTGAFGRIVRIGAFGSRAQAKLGWRYMVSAYPAVAHLPATVVESLNSRGRRFYRFQIGTTSQAHSEVLCQRMEKIGLSCAVVGLPWKPKGVER